MEYSSKVSRKLEVNIKIFPIKKFLRVFFSLVYLFGVLSSFCLFFLFAVSAFLNSCLLSKDFTHTLNSYYLDSGDHLMATQEIEEKPSEAMPATASQIKKETRDEVLSRHRYTNWLWNLLLSLHLLMCRFQCLLLFIITSSFSFSVIMDTLRCTTVLVGGSVWPHRFQRCNGDGSI